jgi:hypothetical protein
MMALTISAVHSAANSPTKSSASSDATREARRSVSIRSTNDSSGGRLRRTSTCGSTSFSRPAGRGRVGGSGVCVGASAKGELSMP